MIRIGIDYRFAKTHRGIGMYLREMVKQLIRLDAENVYILYVDEELSLDLPVNFVKKLIPQTNILLFEQVYLPLQAQKDKLDVLWYPSNSGPLFLPASIRLVVTVHDLIVFSDLNAARGLSIKSFKFRCGEYYRRFALKLGLARIDQLLTVSEYTGLQINSLFKRDAIVITNNISAPEDLAEDDSVLQRFNLQPGTYLYTMTGDSPHKNLKGLLEIFFDQLINTPLVVSGVKNGSIMENYPEELRSKVLITGYVTEAEKNSLYKNARAFLFLSLYEGFGIPLLEAMRFNLPIIASSRSSIPEVLGDAGTLVDPENKMLVKKLIIELSDNDPGFADFKVAREKQLSKFSSWETSALKLLQSFQRVNNSSDSVKKSNLHKYSR